ncbi:type I secretion protein TolC [Endozoicomonas sp. OPT23]|uniref:TolC family outer membrane protein n=1 Tax=Endozoicomonas sp. OPT23 TaxID=2072845 RepID=UPI00129B01E5|nr:TolC family outer membrane protein [Endozoicomonas sp. OPT23]MRI35077.1 type I secretion protein TolC [Endozoicomonas sp. OPT23]
MVRWLSDGVFENARSYSVNSIYLKTEQGKHKMYFKAFGLAGVGLLFFSSTLQADTLLDSVNEALATNPEVKIRVAEAGARQKGVLGAKAGYRPTIDLRAGIGYENTRNSTTIGFYNAGLEPDKDLNRTRRDASIVARQMLYDGQAVKSEVARQKARHASAGFEVCTAAENTAMEATQVYLDVLRQSALLGIARENVKELRRIVERIRRQGEIGRSNEADVAQAESRLVLAMANRISSESLLRDAIIRYQKTIGRLPDSLSMPSAPAMLPSVEKALLRARSNHPVLRQAVADIQAAEAQYEASRSRFSPRFELEVGADWSRDANGGKGDEYTHTARLNMTYNLYNGGGDKARKEQASKLLNEAIEIRNRAQRQVEEEVRFAWVSVEFGQKRLAALKEHVRQAGRSNELYNKQFATGVRTLLDLLDSQNEYYSSRLSEINAVYDLAVNQHRLLQSSGTLILSMGVSMPEEYLCREKIKY